MSNPKPDHSVQVEPIIETEVQNEVNATSPFSPSNLFNLFFRPRRFYSDNIAFNKGPYLLIFAFLYSVALTIDRIDDQLFRSSNGASSRADFLYELTDSWSSFLLFVLIVSVGGAIIVWSISIALYQIRLNFSEVKNSDKHIARAVYFSSGFVQALPVVLSTFIALLFYPSYRAFYNSDMATVTGIVTMILYVWSVVISYIGVRTRFDVHKWKARIWFLILPLFIAIGSFLAAAIFLVLAEL